MARNNGYSFTAEHVDELKRDIKDLEEEVAKKTEELSQCLENYHKKNQELSKCKEDQNKLKAELRDLKALLDKKNNECEELERLLTQSETQVSSLNDALNEKDSLIKSQGEKISELEKNLLERNKEITDLRNAYQLKTEEREASLEVEQKKLNSKMDWLIGCLNEERFSENVPQDQDNEQENKLNLIYKLTNEKRTKYARACYDEIRVRVSEAFQDFINKPKNGVSEIEGDRLIQPSNFTTRTRRMYSEVTSSSGHVLVESQFPSLEATFISSSPSSPTPNQARTQSPIQSPSSSSEESEDDISTFSVYTGGNHDITEDTNKNHKTPEKKTRKKPQTATAEKVTHGFPCKFCPASFRVPGVLQQHVTSKHSNCPRKVATKRKLSLPPSTEQRSPEATKKNKTMGGRCPQCKTVFPYLAQLKMHVKKKHKSKHTFDELIISLDHCDMNKSNHDNQNEVEMSSDPDPPTSLPENQHNTPASNGHHDDQAPVPPVIETENQQQEESAIEKEIIHEKSGEKACSCTRRFKTATDLKRHLTHVNKKKNYECASCPLRFANVIQLQSHSITEHPVTTTTNLNMNNDDEDGGAMDVSIAGDQNDDYVPLASSQLGSTKSNDNDTTDHCGTATGNDPEENDENTMRGFEGITVSHDGEDEADENNINSTNTKGGTDSINGNNEIDDCDEVGIECLSSPDENKLKCCWCPLTFSVESAAQAHAKSVHQGELVIAVKAENGGNFACQTCFQTFETEQELREHLNTNHLTNV